MKKFPFRFLFFTFIALFVSMLYLWGWYYTPNNYILTENISGKEIVTGIESDSAGFEIGDQILSINGERYANYFYGSWETTNKYKPGELVYYEILRDGEKLPVQVKLRSELIVGLDFYLVYYFLILVVIAIGIFLLYKKPEDKSTRIFFIFTQVFAVCLNSQIFISPEFTSVLRNVIFMFTFPFLGSLLIHFFLIFPKESKIKTKLSFLPYLFYFMSIIFSVYGAYYINKLHNNISFQSAATFFWILQLSVYWMSCTLLAAFFLAVFNYISLRDKNYNSQLKFVLVGVVFGLLPEAGFGFFNEEYQKLDYLFPNLQRYVWAAGSIILITSLSFALLKYKLWEIEVVIKRGIIYSSLTVIIVGIYLVLITTAQSLIHSQSLVLNIIIVLISAFTFLPLREFIQHKVEKIFHRESYDPTTALLDFENYIMNPENIFEKIGIGVDRIIHFKNFLFFTKKKNGISLAYSKMKYSADLLLTDLFFEEAKNNVVLNASEYYGHLPELKTLNIKLIFPLQNEEEILGYFLCGEKLSERSYSNQDIELLKLLSNRAARTIMMITYQIMELERRLILEKERLRISKDMHDDVGSNLTKIAILTDVVKNDLANNDSLKINIEKISKISRGLVDNIGEIVWAINPKNDLLDNTIAYIREFASEFLDGTGIDYEFNADDDLKNFYLSSEKRRNIFLTVKEALNNVVKHSTATRIVLNIDQEGNSINFNISDNGKGITEENKFGNGLTNMKSRIEEIKGEFFIESGSGSGVNISFSVPAD